MPSPIIQSVPSIQDSFYKARREYELPENIQIARVNGKLMRGEITQGEASRQVFAIRARFENDVNAIMEIR